MPSAIARVISCDDPDDNESTIRREWLTTNGLGGFSSGTLSGSLSRRYHGLLVAALPAPLGRTVMLSRLQEKIIIGNETFFLNDQELIDTRASKSCMHLKEFRLEMGLPVWIYQIDKFTLEKRILLERCRNTLLINYTLLEAPSSLELELRPAVHFRSLEAAVDQDTVDIDEYKLTANNNIYQIRGGNYPPLLIQLKGSEHSFNISNHHWDNIYFRLEYERGYAAVGKHWSPGFFKLPLHQDQSITLIATTEDVNNLPSSFDEVFTAEIERRINLIATAPPHLQHGEAAELVLAADQFIITPAGRQEETKRARAIGEEVKTIIAGYHWFTDWGRDTMISLEGLTLATGRYSEARHILRTFSNYICDGLIPNMFPEHDNNGLYHTADATLWFFHALHRYVNFTEDRETLRDILPKLISIIDHHIFGTRFNIGIDPVDGLLHQGAEGYQLTWMDAKVGDWVVTPRRGKAVELNALWYNALCVMEAWLSEEKDAAGAIKMRVYAERAKHSFNARFWNESSDALYDVIDGPAGLDDSCRPNQILSIALPHPVLNREHWPAVVNQVEKHLLTPVGLRSLSPRHAAYKQNYDGDLHTRDAAYHQGTVWGWLIGPYIDAWVKTYPENRTKVNDVLAGFYQHMSEAGIGSISEIFDAEPPYTPRGCIAQAWSVAEVLRCLATYGTKK
ncbi:MAG: amylo-alpha-1,6-glucosidase [Cellvibrio sp.]|uniref:amylo-alpha-1,6-glucosidase n=1 Tax=Cellvibrio sp. TaxID=1965322 RepID=UPI00271803B6|nr:amylo-alpha-1,6-glucosidase [Cellvibrio sp.]